MRSGGRSCGCCNARLASTSSITSVLLHLLLELAQLPVRGGLARRVVQIGLEQIALQIGVGAHAPRLLQVAPGALGRALGLGERPVPLGAPELRLHIDQLALVQAQLLPQGPACAPAPPRARDASRRTARPPPPSPGPESRR